MGLDVPDLDDRTYEQLLENAMKRIPVHSDEWTDHNAHDPGVTILELLAWVAETEGYQLDRVTDAHRRKYLELVGVTPAPPERATAALRVTGDEPLDGTTVAAGTPLAVETPDGDVERFEAAATVALTSARPVAVVSEHDQGRPDHTANNEREGLSFPAFGTDAGPGSALYLGFDADPFAGADSLDLHVDYHDADLPAPASHGDETPAFDPSLTVAWQYCSGPASWYDDTGWTDLPVDHDGTLDLHRGGRVSLAAPDDWDSAPASILDRDQELYWLRCTPRPDERDGLPESGAVVVEAADSPVARYEVPPRLDAIRTNVVPVTHRDAVGTETLERAAGDGAETAAEPGQVFTFAAAPVTAGTVVVGDTEWVSVDDFDASGPDDRHYVLDAAAGTVTFGDGRRGAVPPAGVGVEARDVVYGGGPAGNVPRGSTWQFTDDDLRTLAATPLARPTGGHAAESVEEALVRARRERRVPFRAVTAADYRDIATSTPGLRFGRAAAVPTDPDGLAEDAGMTVVVVPHSPPPGRPVPTRGFLDAVGAHFCEHLLLSDRVRVVAPTYVGVDVTAEVRFADDAAVADARSRAVDAVRAFLDPLAGFEGDGWPFGRPVHVSEIYEVLEGLPAVETVLDVTVVTDGAAELAEDGTALPAPEDVDVLVRDGPGSHRRGG